MLLKVTFHLDSSAPLMKFNHKSNQTGTHVEVGRGTAGKQKGLERVLGSGSVYMGLEKWLSC